MTMTMTMTNDWRNQAINKISEEVNRQLAELALNVAIEEVIEHLRGIPASPSPLHINENRPTKRFLERASDVPALRVGESIICPFSKKVPTYLELEQVRTLAKSRVQYYQRRDGTRFSTSTHHDGVHILRIA